MWYQQRRQDFGSGGGNILGGRPRRGSGGRRPPDARKVWKFQKNFPRKLQKMDYFRRFFKKIKKPCVKFSRIGRKTQLCGKFLREFSKISLKIAQKCIILVYFQNPALNFRAFWRKTIVLEIFEKIFKNFFENSTKNALFWSIFKKDFKTLR